MKGRRLQYLWLTLALFALTAACFFFVINRLYGLTIVSVLLIAAALWLIFYLQTKTIREVQKMIAAIRYNDFTLGVSATNGSKFHRELSAAMNKALRAFQGEIQNMEAQQQYNNALLSTIDAGIMVVDETGKIEWINRSALSYFGRPAPRKLSDLAKVGAEIPETLSAVRPRELKVASFVKEGEMQQLAVAAMFFIVQGKKLKLISLKNIHEALMENEIESWKKLIRVLTHEIMNSFTPIISLSETLSERAENTEKNFDQMLQGMKVIHHRSKHLLEFIENYRKLSKIPVPQKTVFPLSTLLFSLRNLFANNAIPIEIALTDEELAIHADYKLLEQLLINIIKNSQEACRDVENPCVRIEAGKLPNRQIAIKISDNGCGMDAALLNEIFIPFFTTKQGGSGVGLTICRNIAIMHGGSISAASELGRGSCFEVRI